MRKNLGAKPAVYPQPVLIIAAYDENGVPNAMSAAWGGISGESELFACISAGHKTTKNILASGAFTVSIATEEQLAACDYVGMVSGNKVPDKIAKSGFNTTKSEFVNAPVINELPLALECTLTSYDNESCHLIGEIVNVSAEESILNDAGNVDPAKLRPLTFDIMNGTYLALGGVVAGLYVEARKLDK